MRTPLQQVTRTAGPEQLRAYQIYLLNEKKLAPISIMVAISALRFL